MLDALKPHLDRIRYDQTPVATATPNMWHLSTRIEGELRGSATSLELALALHPTPAVCGTPVPRAREWIQQVEPFDRGYFTGSLGYMDANGDGDWVVTIRCAEVRRDRVRLFAGAGIVDRSDPQAEFQETENKMGTMLRALELD